MNHPLLEKQDLLVSVRRVKSKVHGIEHALETEAGLDPVVHLAAGVADAMAGLMAKLARERVQDDRGTRLMDAGTVKGASNVEVAEQLLEVANQLVAAARQILSR